MIKKLVLTAILFIASCSLAQAEPFSFAVICDSRGKFEADKCSDDDFGTSPVLKPLVRNILEKHSERKIDLILFPGDLISGYYKRDETSVQDCNRKQFTRWKEIFSPITEAGIAIRITAGNHEAIATSRDRRKCGEHQYPYTPALENFEVFKEVLGDFMVGNPGPACDLGLTYSFDQGSSHFVVLNSYNMLHANAFSEETMQWLMHDLETAKKTGKHIFVASHPPAFPGSRNMWDSISLYDPTYGCDGYDPLYGIDRRRERDRFWNILKRNGVTAYFCGHEHNIQVQLVEGVWHVVSGGLTEKIQILNGAPGDKHPNTVLYDGRFQNPRASVVWPWNEGKKSYWGWCLITIEDEKISMEVLGSPHLPKDQDDFKLLKKFQLKE